MNKLIWLCYKHLYLERGIMTKWLKCALPLGYVLVPSVASCQIFAPPTVQSFPGVQFRGCLRVTIEELWKNPWKYGGKHICVSGYLVRMVPHGEDDVELAPTRAGAHEKPSTQYLPIGASLTWETQVELSKYSEKRLQAVGRFTFEPGCWPDRKTGAESPKVCTEFMHLEDATLSK